MPGPTNYDLATLAYNLLARGTDAKFASVRSLVVGDVDGILEAGDMTREILNRMETARRDQETVSRVERALCLAVQDDGEEVLSTAFRQKRIIIRIYDRFRGIRNIRLVREALIQALDQHAGTLEPFNNQRRAILVIQYMGCAGHRRDADLAIDFDALTFVAVVEYDNY